MVNVWEKLSAINVNEHVKSKGGFSYLAWTWAWATVKGEYPNAVYRVLDDVDYADGTKEVRCEVTIEDMTHMMWLPVTDHKNKAITNPGAFDINTARMRCLVKCLAMFGLGHYIYAGESVPAEAPLSDEVVESFNLLLSQGDPEVFAEFFNTLSPEHQTELVNSAEYGKKGKLKDQVRDALGEFNKLTEDYAAAICEAVEQNDPSGAAQLRDELKEGSEYTKTMVINKLDGPTKAGLKRLLEDI